MAYRVFLALVLIVSAYFAFETIRFKFIQHSLLNADQEYVLGNPDGDVTLVMFFSYECKECIEQYKEVILALKQDGNVKFIPKPMQFEQNPSTKIVYAAGQQGKFNEMHDIMIDNFLIVDAETKNALAKRAGVDIAQFEKDMDSEDVKDLVFANSNLFISLRLNSIPTFAVGKDILFSAPDLVGSKELLNVFDEARGR